MRDVKRELRRYLDETPAVTVGEVASIAEARSVGAVTSQRRVDWWRGPLVAVATAVAALVIVGIAVLALRGGSAGVTDTPGMTATSVAPPATTEPLAATRTTIPYVPSGLVVYPHFFGELVRECVFSPTGAVRPSATVTMDDGIHGAQTMIPDGDLGPPYPADEGWQRWVGGLEDGYPLQEGWNVIFFTAMFENGHKTSSQDLIICDPTLQAVYGYITGMSTTDGVAYELAFEAAEIDEQPDGWSTASASPVVYPVAGWTTFVVYDRTGRSLYSESGFAELLAEHDAGMCDLCNGTAAISTDDCPERCIAACCCKDDCDPIYTDIAFELLIDQDGFVVQAKQLDPTAGTCCR